MPEIFHVYQALWRAMEQLGAAVVYGGSLEDGVGNFHPDPHESGESAPTITIGRPYYAEGPWPTRHRNAGGCALPPPDLLAETVTLAHESGHFLSWRDRTPTPEWQLYFDAAKARDAVLGQVPGDGTIQEYNDRARSAIQTQLHPEQIALILLEEARAWDIGRELLHSFGFDAFDYGCGSDPEHQAGLA